MLLRCKTSFRPAGRPVMVQRGDLVDSSDPVVNGREHLFESVEDIVEAATAAPGESRTVAPRKRAAKKAAAKKAAAPKPDEV